MSSSPIDRVLSKVCNPKPSGDGWISSCPVHEKQGPILKIEENQDGSVNMKCFAECETEKICKAMELTMDDLRPNTPPPSTQPQRIPGKEEFRRQDRDNPFKNSARVENVSPRDTAKSLGSTSMLPTSNEFSTDSEKDQEELESLPKEKAERAESDDLSKEEEILETVEVEASKESLPPTSPQCYQSFPVSTLPEPLRRFVEEATKAIGCDSSFLVLPLLSALASAIGNSRELELKSTWYVPAIIWTVIIGESGTSKTPARKQIMEPLDNRQSEKIKEHSQEMEGYENDLLKYEKELGAWKKDKNTTDPPPQKPNPPVCERLYVNDTTVEALVNLLSDNSRGVLVSHDELSGWLASFDKYSNGNGGSDAAHWLSMHSGESITVDRKTSNKQIIHVPDALVSLTGGIQPNVLKKALGTKHQENGLAARMLMAFPPRKERKWSEDTIDSSTKAEFECLLRELYDLQPSQSPNGDETPQRITLNEAAEQIWRDFYEKHNKEQTELSGSLAAAWSKLEEYAARLALVHHCSRCCAKVDNPVDPLDMDESSMQAGIDMAEWFKNEAKRVYERFSESKQAKEQRELMEWIEHKGGEVTVRELQQGNRKYPTSAKAEQALQDLVDAGYGTWEDLPQGVAGGRPSRVFRLATLSTVYDTLPKPEDYVGSVDGDRPESESDDDCEEI